MKRLIGIGVVLLSLVLGQAAQAGSQDPVTAEQTLICLNPNLNPTDYPEAYALCHNVIAPYVCSVYWKLPNANGFTAPPYSAYMLPWNNACGFGTYKQVPPPG